MSICYKKVAYIEEQRNQQGMSPYIYNHYIWLTNYDNNQNKKYTMDLFYKNEKISTDILGLDRLLFGGIILQEPSIEKAKDGTITKISGKELVITITGKSGTSRALLAMQLLHGITKNMRLLAQENKTGIGLELGSPIFYSDTKDTRNLEDMILDTLISKCVNSIIEDRIKDKTAWSNCDFCSTIFDLNKKEIARKNIKQSQMDILLSEEVIVYNNRTNALHFVLPQGKNENNCNDTSNLIAHRISNNINDYCKINGIHNLGHLTDEFFPIYILDSLLKRINTITLNTYIPCLVLDLNDTRLFDSNEIKKLRERSLVTIIVLNEESTIQEEPNIRLELRSYEDEVNNYVRHELCIKKSVLQTTALGWHRYKKRDYGIEIYPSVHVLLQRRRHMPKALLRGYSDVLTDTYQQFIDNSPNKNHYDTYIIEKKQLRWKRLSTIYRTLQEDQNICKLLNSILIEPKLETDDMESQVSVIIGEPNSYKRYLSLGGTFSSCCRQEHTLNILFNQEYYTMRKRLVCPTWAFKANKNKISCEGQSFNCDVCSNKCRLPFCQLCYEYIHFWDLRMGYISSDEFFYYLLRQIRLFPNSQNKEQSGIRRIVIDDIQKIDYCFPLLKEDPLFLPALIAICKDRGIDLCILCDKNASLVKHLRSLADNVICMERLDEKDSRIYIERSFGYNAPSHIFGGKIENIENLFTCDNRNYSLHETSIKPIIVPNMNHFWVCNDTNKILSQLKNKK